jgi:hypothetical protein
MDRCGYTVANCPPENRANGGEDGHCDYHPNLYGVYRLFNIT